MIGALKAYSIKLAGIVAVAVLAGPILFQGSALALGEADFSSEVSNVGVISDLSGPATINSDLAGTGQDISPLYVIGAGLVLAGVVVLIVKKKISKSNKRRK